MQRNRAWVSIEILLFVLLCSCGIPHDSWADSLSGRIAMQETAVVPPMDDFLADQASVPDDFYALLGGQGGTTAECFQLQPGSKRSKGGRARRCEPQSLPFARCRSGIDSCRLGHENSPLSWFSCEKQQGNTSLAPRSGSILILAANGRRKMPTGHVAYVEEVVAQSDTVYRLTFTHTNYDRRCSLESNIEATYDSVTQTLDIQGGAWQAWGKGLPVAGFILD